MRRLSLAIVLMAMAWDAGAQELSYRVFDKVVRGDPSTKPGLEITPSVTMRHVVLRLERSDGTHRTLRAGVIPAGRAHRFTWDQPLGEQHYRAAITWTRAMGKETTARLEFDVRVVEPLRLELVGDKVDLEARRVAFRTNRPVSRAEVTVKPDHGDPISETLTPTQMDHGVYGLTWPEVPGKVQFIGLEVFDDQGFWAKAELQPWWIEVEHEEVHFDTGKATFRPEEARKLDDSLGKIRELLARYGGQAKLSLYIAGYTDTVGSAASNQALSEARAAAIASYLQRRGLKIPTFYQGFGEDVLAVQTADEVDEPANRRAIYILGTVPPPTSPAIPRSDWRRLR